MKNIVLFFGLCVLCCGCQILYKSPAQPEPPLAVRSPDSDKVWIEAQRRKIWVNAHVDDNGDMIDGHYKHVVITPGHWAVKGK